MCKRGLCFRNYHTTLQHALYILISWSIQISRSKLFSNIGAENVHVPLVHAIENRRNNILAEFRKSGSFIASHWPSHICFWHSKGITSAETLVSILLQYMYTQQLLINTTLLTSTRYLKVKWHAPRSTHLNSCWIDVVLILVKNIIKVPDFSQKATQTFERGQNKLLTV